MQVHGHELEGWSAILASRDHHPAKDTVDPVVRFKPGAPAWSARRERFGIRRPALANMRVQTKAAGQVELKLKTPWRDDTTHLVISPLEFMQLLAASSRSPQRTAGLLLAGSLWFGAMAIV